MEKQLETLTGSVLLTVDIFLIIKRTATHDYLLITHKIYTIIHFIICRCLF